MINNSFYNTALSIKDFEEMLCEFDFFRANAATIINMKFIREKIQPGEFITMNNGETVNLSLKKRDAFIKKLAML